MNQGGILGQTAGKETFKSETNITSYNQLQNQLELIIAIYCKCRRDYFWDKMLETNIACYNHLRN